MKTPKAKLFFCAVLLSTMGLTAFLNHYSENTIRHSGRNIEKAGVFGYKHYPENELPQFAQKSIDWLASVQFENGGWGAGTHAEQHIKDAKSVKVDAGTTSFAAMALLRAGNTLIQGKYSNNVNKALNLLLEMVEASSEENFMISNITGTQPQVKLGQNIDASLASQFFIRILPFTKQDANLEKRVSNALDKCLRKITKSQAADGSVQGGGWAPVLQSAMANNALELADNIGRDVDKKALENSKNYQRKNIDAKSGEIKTEEAAGVTLYSVVGSQRATAKDARRADELMERGRKEGKLAPDAKLSRENLIKTGYLNDKEADDLYNSYAQNQATVSKMQDDRVISGFGNNGGEEFLSFMLTSESLVITGGENWKNWKNKMLNLLANIQNSDGSWNGHHCITSPVFCTAAAILSLTAENDKELLTKEKKK